MKIYANQ